MPFYDFKDMLGHVRPGYALLGKVKSC